MRQILKKVRKKAEKGFTLVETLVAIFILVLAITGPMSVAYQSIKYVRLAADRSVATMLAQDAMEYILAKKNYNIVNGDDWMKDMYPSSGPKKCNDTPIGCTIDTSKPLGDSNAIQKCTGAGDECEQLRHNGSMYTYDVGADETRFTRTVHIDTPDNHPDDERIIWVEVTYTSGVFSGTYKLRLNVFKSNV